MSASPTSRSLAYARKQGWRAGVVEKWVPRGNPKPGQPPGVRVDLFGVFDLVLVLPNPPLILAVQACAGASHAARRDKVAAAAVLPDWLAAGAAAEVWSWSKQGARGKRKLWTLRREEVRPS